MEFVFQLSAYDDPALDRETEALLEQLLEARSRRALPGLWKVTDGLSAYAAKGTGWEKRRRRHRVYGGILLALGVFALVPGLMEPRVPGLIGAGTLAIAWGLWSLCLRGRRPPASLARGAAEEKLARMRNLDWTGVRLRFDQQGQSTSRGEEQGTPVPYAGMQAVLESEHAWLVVYDEARALLLQKKDLTQGNPEEFLPYIREKIGK